MNVYHKKNFVIGLVLLGMGVCCLVYVFRAEIIDLGWAYVMAVSLCKGTTYLRNPGYDGKGREIVGL